MILPLSFRQIGRLVVIGILGLTLAQCSDSEVAQSPLTYTVAPEKPVVIDADWVTTTKTYSKNWFIFRVGVSNASRTKSYTIMSFQLKFSGREESGVPVEGTLSVASEVGLPLVTLAPSASDSSPTMIVAGIPGSALAGYSIEVKVIGWEGTPTSPTGRLLGRFLFTTE